MPKTWIHCGTLYTGMGDGASSGQTLVLDGDTIRYCGPKAEAPRPGHDDVVIDHGERFVMPGMIDAHTHLSYGCAASEEEVDLYATLEYRAIRALRAAQDMLRAGFTTLLDPACSGMVTPAARDAIECGLYSGPRITTAGPALTSHQGLYDYYPSWIGAPAVSSGLLVKSREDAIMAIRRQAKDGVDMIKIAMDGIMGDRERGLYAAFDQDEITAMVREAHRLGRKVGVHARGTEGALYSARAGVDIIYHGSRICEDGIRAALDDGTALSPSLLMLVNNIQYAQPDDPSYGWWPNIQRKELKAARECIAAAKAAGVPILNGSESGFAITLYGEWAAKELEISVELLGMTPAEALHSATAAPAKFLREQRVGTLAAGSKADLLVLSANPLEDIRCLQQPECIKQVWLGGKPVDLTPPPPARRHPAEDSQGMWARRYTRSVVAGITPQSLELVPEQH
ncbi:amidohydrolase family protein [Caballeronia sp. LZ043]|uniref:metal-dependent hydrolase family protein n=1 Tax=Caballeronia sp. LZ043 TaxID=3038569 RepID=UPI00285CC354|nr:amidohydrolase family protein [Caballeronia sp. LZ043]MDR5822466.1 amidohydrolase family protein [Caballeronia sp. LZ043]